MKAVAAICVVCVAGAVGCASGSRSVLYQGISSPLRPDRKLVVTDAQAAREARSVRAEWLATVERDSRHPVGHRVASVSLREFRSRLAAAAARYGFTVRRVEFVQPLRPAPLVVLETSRYVALARAVPAIEHSLDPHTGHSDLRGWSFRAFYLEALDERGVPFLVVDNVVASDGVAGGQWARSDALFPFVRV